MLLCRRSFFVNMEKTFKEISVKKKVTRRVWKVKRTFKKVNTSFWKVNFDLTGIWQRAQLKSNSNSEKVLFPNFTEVKSIMGQKSYYEGTSAGPV